MMLLKTLQTRRSDGQCGERERGALVSSRLSMLSVTVVYMRDVFRIWDTDQVFQDLAARLVATGGHEPNAHQEV